jgi:cytochrome c-type biogenesis protein CcmE
MNPSRKRKVRLVVALAAAVFLASALVYTSFSASSEAKTPSQLLTSSNNGQTYSLTGTVVNGSVNRPENGPMTFRVRDRDGTESVAVSYTGAVPDPFRDGREVIVTVKKGTNGTFIGQTDSLVTKCPSKFTADESTSN